MKRDFNLIRALLLEIERSEEMVFTTELQIEGYDSAQIAYHAALLADAGLIVGGDSSTTAGPRFNIERLTFEGHDFLDAIRAPSVWRKTRDRIAQAGGGFVLTVVKETAVAVLREQLNLRD